MHPALILSASVTTSLLTAVAVLAFGPDSHPAEARAPIAAEAVHPEFEQLMQQVAALDERLAILSIQAPEPARRPVAPESEAIEAVVRRLLAEESAAIGVENDESDSESALAKLARDPLRALAKLLAAGHDSDEAAEIWAAAKEAGTLDDLLDLFRERVDADPDSVEANYDMARAALAAARQDPNHPNGSWWGESDESYATVLELDPDYSEARYEKAVGLMFWPDAFGRAPESIRHFERLLGDAGNLAEANHRKTYYWLGNMHAQSGRTEEAIDVWRRGLSTFPGDESLIAKMAELERR